MKYSNIGMKIAVAAVGALLTLSIAAIVEAQSTGLRASIPFEFYVGDTLLPAGTYTVTPQGTSGAISLADNAGHSASRLTNAVTGAHARSSAASALIFTVYGERHFLSEVRWSGYPPARGLVKSKMELEVAKALPAGREPRQESIAAKK
jgi:hypothetical protein